MLLSKPIILVGMLLPTIIYLPISQNTRISLSFFICILALTHLNPKILKAKKTTRKYLALSFIFIVIQIALLALEKSSILSFLQAAFFILFVTAILTLDIKYTKNFNPKTIATTAKISLATITFVCLIQAMEFYLLNSTMSIDLISAHQINDNHYILSQLSFGNFRAIGPYYEPSYLAMMALLFWTIINAQSNTPTIKYDAAIAIICLAAGSLALTLGASLLIILRFFITKRFTLLNAAWITMLLPIILLLAYVAASTSEQLQRINELNQVGSSGFYRLVAPLEILEWVLFENIAPIPLGSINDYLYEFKLSEDIRKTFDNGYYILVANFSWLGILLISLFTLDAFKNFKNDYLKSDQKALIWPFLIILPMFNGLVFSPEIALIIAYLVISYRAKSHEESISINNHCKL